MTLPSEGNGSIPACAGEPPNGRAAASDRKVYPRVCGGTVRATPTLCRRQGLSPRVRGNRLFHHPGGRHRGSIPACAGEPRVIRKALADAGVYPRVCGGTEKGEILAVLIGGLSPRVRGNPANAA